ncbi:hypothetical protein [Corynebacterium macclintockiae]|uniref:hypothetical protein n=2 Tax=Corynebacterium macclintockiae TaxID=2913501 RepID=UPI003EBB9BCF
MLRNTRIRLATMALIVTLPLAAAPVAAAETPAAVESAGTVDEQALAQYFAKIDNAQTEKEAHDALVDFLGEDAANQAIKENSATGQSVSTRGAGTFLTCIKGKASDDIKSVFDINVVAAAIGQKNYAKAAKEAVKYLAKQGVKRNAAAVAGMFAYWGWQCRGSW